MSSILKALKKLESESTATVEIKSVSQTLDTSKVIQSPSSRRDAKVTIFAFCVLLVGVAGLGYFFYQNQGSQLESDSAESVTKSGQDITITQPDSIKPEDVEAIQREQQKPLQREAIHLSEPAVIAPHLEPTVEDQKMQTETASKPNSKVEVSGQPILKTETTANLSVTEYAETKLLEKKEVVSGKEKEQLEEPVYPRLNYSILELQAITWAVKPQERFVLVENRILRTGESIKGYVVDSIHEGHVVVRQGYEKWRVEFRLR